MKRLVMIGLVITVVMAGVGWAAVPAKILFQGVLTDKATGQPPASLTAADVQYSFNNSNYTAVNTSGFSYDSTTGFFSAYFGKDPATGGDLNPTFFSSTQVWIKIKNGTAMGPQELVSSPYAFRADYAEKPWIINPLDNSGTELYYMYTQGKVAIGKQDPAYKLDVYGDINYSGKLLKNGLEVPIGGSTSQWQDVSGGITYTAGNVGIGKASPTGILEVANRNGEDAILRVSGVAANSTDKVQIGDVDGAGNDEVLTIDGATKNMHYMGGNVGIGTTTPGFKLDVHASAADTARIGQAQIGGWPSNSNYAYFGNDAVDQSVSGNYAVLQGAEGATYLNTASGKNMNFRVSNITKMVMDSAGKLGVGVTSPGSTLHVKGSGYLQGIFESTNSSGGIKLVSSGTTPSQYELQALVDGGLIIYDRTDGRYDLKIDTNGNIGIGTTSPTARLETVNDLSSGKAVYGRATNTFGIAVEGNASDAVGGYSGKFYGGKGVYIQNKLGVGTDPSTYQLSVAGNASTTWSGNIENASTSTASKGLRIKCGPLSNPGSSNWFMTFSDGNYDNIGHIAGNGVGGVAYRTTGADYAEYFSAEETISGKKLVGLNLKTGKVRAWRSGDPLVGVVSSSPGFVGNDIEDSSAVLVALLGQVEIEDDAKMVINNNVVKTSDGQKIGYLLANGRILIDKK